MNARNIGCMSFIVSHGDNCIINYNEVCLLRERAREKRESERWG